MFHKIFKTTIRAITLPLAVIAIIGCGDSNNALVAPNMGDVGQAENGIRLEGTTNQVKTLSPQNTYFNFLPHTQAATKKGKNSTSEKIKKKKGGRLVIEPEEIPESDVQLVSATFTIKKKSIDDSAVKRNRDDDDDDGDDDDDDRDDDDDEIEIGMSIQASQDLQSLIISFSPSGLAFHPNAELELVIEGKLDKDAERALHMMYHRHGDNNEVTLLKTDVQKKKKTYKVKVRVPGFSQYYWDDDGSESNDDSWWDDIDEAPEDD